MNDVADSRWSLSPQALADELAASLDRGDAATPWLTFWYAGLQDTATRATARRLASELAARAEAGRWPYPALHVRVIGVSWAGQQQQLVLVLTDTVFEPEAWSRTFLEGLLRRSPAAWHDAEVIEVGTGSGWISIALSRFTTLRRVIALDLNPDAVAVARINVYLNGMADDGTHLNAPGFLPLWDRVTCFESDLLQAAIAQNVRADAIIGCIPQVLQPALTPQSRTEALYDLSNYCAVQGLVEDQFGLGLNAAAIDQGLDRLKQGGVLILNLAGRPGAAAVTRMFTRRGLTPRTLWRTRIPQATDTAVDSLVQLELETRQDFEFFLHRQSPRPIPARTAREVLKAGVPVWHELRVIEARPALGELTQTLVRQLRSVGLESAMRDIDLAPVDQEQAQFVVRLAGHLGTDPHAPYPHEAGDLTFRQKVAAYLARYAGRSIGPEALFIGPGRSSTYHALGLALSHRGQRWLVNRALYERLLPVATRLECALLPGPDAVREMSELMELIKPDLVALATAEGEVDAVGEIGELVSRAAAAGVPLILDGTQWFEITSRATGGGVIGALAEHPLGHYPIFVLGLERSRVYPGLSVTLVVHPDRALHARLEAAAEATYSRIGWFQQRYFEDLFDEMTTFRMWGAEERSSTPPTTPLQPLPAGRIDAALLSPALARPAPLPSTLRLDYGENEGPMPPRLVHGLLAGFLDQKAGAEDPAEERALEAAIARFMTMTRAYQGRALSVTIHHGVWPALACGLEAVRAMRGGRLRVAVPAGHYGMLTPLLGAVGADILTVPTRIEDQFRLRPAALDRLTAVPDVVWLNQPCNPTGVSYAQAELDELVQWAEGRGAWLFCDEVFALLQISRRAAVRGLASPLLAPGPGHLTAVFGGLSKEFAAGGLRLGWMASTNQRLIDAARDLRLDPVPRFALAAGRGLLEAAAQELGFSESPTEQFLRTQAAWLTHNLEVVRRELEPAGIRIPGVDNLWGLSCLLDLRGVTDDAEGWVLRLEQEAGVRLNTPAWSETPGFARLCLSVPRERLEEAVARIRRWMGDNGA